MSSTTLPPLLGEIEQLYGKCVVLTSLYSDGYMTCLLDRERERERERGIRLILRPFHAVNAVIIQREMQRG